MIIITPSTPSAPSGDVIESINLSAHAIEAWHKAIPELLRACRAHGITDPDAIPDERARVLDDGALLLYVCSPDGHDIGIKIPAGQWSAGNLN